MPGAPYLDADRQAASLLVERIDKLNEDRLAMEAIGNTVAAVRDSVLIHDLLDTATPAQLRAALVQLTTPELRPSVPVVIAPTPALPPVVQLYRAVITPAREVYCVDSGRAVKGTGDRCLSHGAEPRMCSTSVRAPRCLHQRLSPNHRLPTCEECGVALVPLDPEELERQYRDSPGFRERGL